MNKRLTTNLNSDGTSSETAIVIGAGAIGTACALQLAREGISTQLIDWRDPGEGCSSGNAGSVSSQSIVPMSLPGMITKVPGWLLDPLGPLFVRWQYFPKSLPWLIRWVIASRMKAVHRSSAALTALLGNAFEEYADLLGPKDFDRLVRRNGQLLVWESPTQSRSEKIGHALREKYGVAMRWLTPGEISDLEPELSPIFTRGLLLERHGQLVDPLLVVQTLANKFREQGGTFVKGLIVDVVPQDFGGARIKVEGGKTYTADHVIIAAGAWSGEIARKLGVSVPLETERGYHVMLPAAQGLCSRPILNADRSFIASPINGGLRIAGTVEIAGLDAEPRYERAEALVTLAKKMFRSIDESNPNYWMGCRPSLPDSVPVIDQSDQLKSIYFAFGHGHLGMTSAPMTASLISDLVVGRKPRIELEPYRITRF